MSKQQKTLTVVLAFLLTALIFSPVLAGESPNYKSYPQALDNGGGKPVSPTHQIRASIGQEVIGLSESPKHIFHAGYLYGAIAHASPRTSKNSAISRLKKLRLWIPEKDWKKLDEAVESIEESLTPLWWTNPWHVSQNNRERGFSDGIDIDGEGPGRVPLGGQGGEDPVALGEKRYGDNVFKKEKEAAKKVKELLRKKYAPEIVEELVAIETHIMDADSTLAKVKIVEAELSAGNPKELKKARDAMGRAEREKAKEKPEYGQVVDFYGKAWHHAVRAEEKGGVVWNAQVASIGADRPSFALGKSYPNPSRSGSVIRYGIAKECRVRLRIYDISGRRIRTLVDGQKQPGYYSCEWDCKDDNGSRVANGTYIYRLLARPFMATRKVTVLR